MSSRSENSPLVSADIVIGLPVFNGERYLRQALDSLLTQSLDDFKLLISDNASTDETQAICDQYASRDPRIVYYRQSKNIGAPANFNFTFTSVESRYFKWACANDICKPSMLEACKAILDQHDDVALCYPGTEIIDAADRVVERYQSRLHLMQDQPAQRMMQLLLTMRLNNAQSGLIRSSMLSKTRLEGIFSGSDVNLMAELSLYGKIYELESPLFQRRISADASTLNKTAAELNKFNRPQSEKIRHMPAIRHHLEAFASVRRSPLPFAEKIDLYRFLARRAWWDRGDLGLDLYESL